MLRSGISLRSGFLTAKGRGAVVPQPQRSFRFRWATPSAKAWLGIVDGLQNASDSRDLIDNSNTFGGTHFIIRDSLPAKSLAVSLQARILVLTYVALVRSIAGKRAHPEKKNKKPEKKKKKKKRGGNSMSVVPDKSRHQRFCRAVRALFQDVVSGVGFPVVSRHVAGTVGCDRRTPSNEGAPNRPETWWTRR